MSRAIVIAGTTASGKTDIAMKLARKAGGYIINADSRQIYRELKIGTSQPVAEKVNSDGSWEIEGVKNYLFGFLSVEQEYNIHKYKEDVEQVMAKENGIAIFTGGTGLYIDSVVFNYDLDSSTKSEPMENLYMFIDIPKEEIDRRIKERIERMFDLGLQKEVEDLWEKYPGFTLKPLNSIGYAEFKDYFEGKTNLDEVKHQIFLHTRQYAKRQRTWFRRNKNVIYVKDYTEVEKLAFEFLAN
jgi:tRNA dimethylallyltransferase